MKTKIMITISIMGMKRINSIWMIMEDTLMPNMIKITSSIIIKWLNNKTKLKVKNIWAKCLKMSLHSL